MSSKKMQKEFAMDSNNITNLGHGLSQCLKGSVFTKSPRVYGGKWALDGRGVPYRTFLKKEKFNKEHFDVFQEESIFVLDEKEFVRDNKGEMNEFYSPLS